MRASATLVTMGLALVLGACGDMAVEAGGGVAPDASQGDTSADAGLSDVVFPGDDVNEQDSGPLPDVPTEDSVAPDVRTLSLKEDPVFLVPGAVAERREIALSATHAAWVERDAPGEPERLMLWALDGASEPVDLDAPYLTQPRQLVLTPTWLFYVDDRYGDPDVFGVRLSDGADVAVVTKPGAQEHPTAVGSLVAWQDCRLCVEGQPQVPAIYAREMTGGSEARVTDGVEPERRPAFGTLADGQEVTLGWLSGATSVAALVDDAETVWDVAFDVDSLALASGKLVWRASKSIINPDSMIPSDVFITDAVTGATSSLSLHGHVEPTLDGAPTASGSRVAWIESIPGAPAEQRRVRMVDLADGGAEPVQTVTQLVGLSQARLGPNHLAVTAPRPDNDGLSDLWILPL